jgi:hypothetical protein
MQRTDYDFDVIGGPAAALPRPPAAPPPAALPPASPLPATDPGRGDRAGR